MTRWFEDVVTGEAHDLGSHTFGEDEIIAFARAYDPQYFHVDPDAARHSHFGGLVASGWHIVSMAHRKMVDALDAEAEWLRAQGEEPGVSGPSPGVNFMEFKAPVRPGDTLHFTLVVTDKRPSNSIPGWGLLFNTVEATNQGGERVYHAEVVAFTKLRG
jgi:acyl dehydratase